VDLSFLIKTGASGLAIALLVALAAWARIARPTPELDEAAVRDILAFEFPGVQAAACWIAADGRGAILRAGDEAFIVYRIGDGYVARSAPWALLAKAAPKNGAIDLRLADVGAPRARFKLGEGAAWPPAFEAAA